MNVLLFGTVVGLGGSQKTLLWLAKALTEANHNVLILSAGTPEGTDAIQYDWQGNYQVEFFKQLDRPVSNRFLRYIQTFQNLVQLANEFAPDVYIGIGSGWNLFLLPRFLPKPVKSIFYEVMSGQASDWMNSRHLGLWCIDEVVTVATTVSQTFQQTFHWRKPIRAIPPFGSHLENSVGLPQPPQTTVEPGKVKACFLGRLSRPKQSLWLVQNWDCLKESIDELHIHGSGPDAVLIESEIVSQGIGDRVKFHGPYLGEGEAYATLLSQYDLMLLPTLSDEGAPLVLMEAMACGIPFVAYTNGGIADYSINNPNVLVTPQQPEAFFAGVKKMATRLELGDIDRVELQQFYLSHYSYASVKTTWLTYLQSKTSHTESFIPIQS